jgi:hypothetical protein
MRIARSDSAPFTFGGSRKQVSRTVGASGFTIEPVVGCRRFWCAVAICLHAERGRHERYPHEQETDECWRVLGRNVFQSWPWTPGWGQGEADSRQLPSGWDQQASHGRIEVRMQHWGHGENWGRRWSSLAGGSASKERPCSGGWGMAVRCPRG